MTRLVDLFNVDLFCSALLKGNRRPKCALDDVRYSGTFGLLGALSHRESQAVTDGLGNRSETRLVRPSSPLWC